MDLEDKIALNAAIGGTAEVLGGGKPVRPGWGGFANGAVTGAYVMMFNHAMHQAQENPKFTSNGMEGKWDWEKLDDNQRAQVIVDNIKAWDYSNGDPSLNNFFYNLPIIEKNVSITINGAVVDMDGITTTVWIRGYSNSPIESAPELKGTYYGLHGHNSDVGFGRVKYGNQLYIDTYYDYSEDLYDYMTTPFMEPIEIPIPPDSQH